MSELKMGYKGGHKKRVIKFLRTKMWKNYSGKLRFKDLCYNNMKCLEKQITWKPLKSASHITLNTTAKQTKGHHRGKAISLCVVQISLLVKLPHREWGHFI